jgi:hypothetical protein
MDDTKYFLMTLPPAPIEHDIYGRGKYNKYKPLNQVTGY